MQTKERTIYLNKHPLGDSNHTDWKGLQQYLRDLQGKKQDRNYAIRTVGNIFKNVAPEPIYHDDMPSYIPRIQDAIAVQWKGQDTWSYYGHLNIEERAAILKRYDGADWVNLISAPWSYYDGADWVNIKWGKYYDGANWITFYTLNNVSMLVLRTSSTSADGWSNVSATFHNYCFSGANAYGANGTGADGHNHPNTTAIFGGTSGTPFLAKDALIPERSGWWYHDPHASVSHPAALTTAYPNLSKFLVYALDDLIQRTIPAGSIVFWSGATGNVPDDWTYRSTNNNYYIRGSTIGTGNNLGALMNPHVTGTQYSGYASSLEVDNVIGSAIDFADFNNSHRHTATHTHNNTYTPYYFNVILMSADNERPEIPINGVVMTTSTASTGLWTRVSAADGRILSACYVRIH